LAVGESPVFPHETSAQRSAIQPNHRNMGIILRNLKDAPPIARSVM